MSSTKNTIKNWFKRGLKPLEVQFHEWMDSFWHKDESIPIDKITGLQDILNGLPAGADQDIASVLTVGNDALAKQLKNLADPTDAQDADTLAARNGAIGALLDGVPLEGDTLNKLYQLITGHAIAATYADVAALLAAQGVQQSGLWYMVTDASTDTTVNSGWGIYQYNGTTAGTLADYLKVAELESLDVVINDAASTVKGIAKLFNTYTPESPRSDGAVDEVNLRSAFRKSKIYITQSAHGFVVGDVLSPATNEVYYKLGSGQTYVIELAGVVSDVIDANNFLMVPPGHVIDTLSGLSPTKYYYYRNGSPNYTTDSSLGILPVFKALSATAAIVLGNDNRHLFLPSAEIQAGVSLGDISNAGYLHFFINSTVGINNTNTYNGFRYRFVNSGLSLISVPASCTIEIFGHPNYLNGFAEDTNTIPLYNGMVGELVKKNGSVYKLVITNQGNSKIETLVNSATPAPLAIDCKHSAGLKVHATVAITSAFSIQLSNTVDYGDYALHFSVNGNVTLTLPSDFVGNVADTRYNQGLKTIALTTGQYTLIASKVGAVFEFNCSPAYE